MSKNAPLLILCLAVAGAAVSSCGQQGETAGVDPRLGRECFEFHRTVLPPGSQYEGFEASAAHIQVKVMTGVDIKTVTCARSPDGTLDLQSTTKGG